MVQPGDPEGDEEYLSLSEVQSSVVMVPCCDSYVLCQLCASLSNIVRW